MSPRAAMLAFLVGSLLQAQNPASEPASAQPNPAAAAPEAPPFVTCPAGGPLGAVDLRIEAGADPLPFRTINHLGEGDTLVYSPIHRGKEDRPGEVALVLLPQKVEKGDEEIVVTDPKPADKTQRWHVSQSISVA